jgi:hypothetical protein
MESRCPVIFFLLILVTFVTFSGCTSLPAQQGTTVPAPHVSVAPEQTVSAGIEKTIPTTSSIAVQNIAEQLSSVKSDSSVWREAYRMFSSIKSTEYVHPPYTVDEAAGIYKFDCLGFVDHVLMNADPAGYKEIGKGLNPSIESYSAYFSKLDTTKPDAAGWTKVVHPVDLKPGDVCLWLKPSTLDTGHMWIIAGVPVLNPKRSEEVLVRIFDSSIAHSDDSRTNSPFKTGLGSGILGMMVDGSDNPAGLYWEGGVSTNAGEKDTTIVCGRLNR